MLSWLTVVFCSVFLVKSLQRVISGVFSTLHLAVIVFFAMQVAPLFVENVWGFDSQMYMITNMHFASLDFWTHLIYCLFCCLTISIFYLVGNLQNEKYSAIRLFSNTLFELNAFGIFILLVGLFSPIVAWIFAPNPSIYFVFGRFYRMTINELDASYIYHMVVMSHVNYVSFLSAILLYFFNDKKSRLINVLVVAGVILFSWLEGKRSILTFALMAVIAIDVFRNRYANEKIKLIMKSCLFALISVVFFLVYKQYTGKDADSEFLSQYNQYYSRMGCVKTAIYSVLEDKPIVEFPGQTLLFDILFFVPRNLWPDKPAMFCKYFTAFAVNRNSTDFLSWNLLVNIWSEFIANLGALGYCASVVLVCYIAKVADVAKNVFLRFWGMLFVLLYFMFGFEYLVMIVYLIFLFMLCYQKIKERL